MIDILEKSQKEEDAFEAPTEYFDVDSEKNWLTAEPGPPAMGAEFGNSIPIGKFGKIGYNE